MDEQALEAEFRRMFERILELGRQQGEQTAYNKIMSLTQTALAESRAGAANRPAAENPPTTNGQTPLRPLT